MPSTVLVQPSQEAAAGTLGTLRPDVNGLFPRQKLVTLALTQPRRQRGFAVASLPESCQAGPSRSPRCGWCVAQGNWRAVAISTPPENGAATPTQRPTTRLRTIRA